MDLFTYTQSIQPDEKQRLRELESKIDAGLKTFVDVGTALLEIRDSRLYRQSHGTFEDYCRDKWGFQRNYANKMIAAAEVIDNLGTIVPVLPATETQVRPLTQLPTEDQPAAWKQAVETAPYGKITAAHVQSVVDEFKADRITQFEEDTLHLTEHYALDNVPQNMQGYDNPTSFPETEKRPVSYHVSDDSYDWYTPAEYIEAARCVMGSIDVDPASSEQAQKIIKADVFFTKEDDGLLQEWSGNVWLNPPYNMPIIEQFIDKTLDSYLSGKIRAAIILTNNSTDTGWFHKLVDYPFCLTKGRIKFWNGDQTLATRQGQAIFYLGGDSDLFSKIFSVFGVVVRKYDN
jgi:phage N-6-adenine-methyltransferase